MFGSSLWAGFAILARAGDLPPPPGPLFLIDAPVDEDPANAWSVGICATEDGECTRRSAACTGTLVAPNLVLTARHCVDGSMQVGQDLCDSSFLPGLSTGR